MTASEIYNVYLAGIQIDFLSITLPDNVQAFVTTIIKKRSFNENTFNYFLKTELVPLIITKYSSTNPNKEIVIFEGVLNKIHYTDAPTDDKIVVQLNAIKTVPAILSKYSLAAFDIQTKIVHNKDIEAKEKTDVKQKTDTTPFKNILIDLFFKKFTTNEKEKIREQMLLNPESIFLNMLQNYEAIYLSKRKQLTISSQMNQKLISEVFTRMLDCTTGFSYNDSLLNFLYTEDWALNNTGTSKDEDIFKSLDVTLDYLFIHDRPINYPTFFNLLKLANNKESSFSVRKTLLNLLNSETILLNTFQYEMIKNPHTLTSNFTDEIKDSTYLRGVLKAVALLQPNDKFIKKLLSTTTTNEQIQEYLSGVIGKTQEIRSKIVPKAIEYLDEYISKSFELLDSVIYLFLHYTYYRINVGNNSIIEIPIIDFLTKFNNLQTEYPDLNNTIINNLRELRNKIIDELLNTYLQFINNLKYKFITLDNELIFTADIDSVFPKYNFETFSDLYELVYTHYIFNVMAKEINSDYTITEAINPEPVLLGVISKDKLVEYKNIYIDFLKNFIEFKSPDYDKKDFSLTYLIDNIKELINEPNDETVKNSFVVFESLMSSADVLNNLINLFFLYEQKLFENDPTLAYLPLSAIFASSSEKKKDKNYEVFAGLLLYNDWFNQIIEQSALDIIFQNIDTYCTKLITTENKRNFLVFDLNLPNNETLTGIKKSLYIYIKKYSTYQTIEQYSLYKLLEQHNSLFDFNLGKDITNFRLDQYAYYPEVFKNVIKDSIIPTLKISNIDYMHRLMQKLPRQNNLNIWNFWVSYLSMFNFNVTHLSNYFVVKNNRKSKVLNSVILPNSIFGVIPTNNVFIGSTNIVDSSSITFPNYTFEINIPNALAKVTGQDNPLLQKKYIFSLLNNRILPIDEYLKHLSSANINALLNSYISNIVYYGLDNPISLTLNKNIMYLINNLLTLEAKDGDKLTKELESILSYSMSTYGLNKVRDFDDYSSITNMLSGLEDYGSLQLKTYDNFDGIYQAVSDIMISLFTKKHPETEIIIENKIYDSINNADLVKDKFHWSDFKILDYNITTTAELINSNIPKSGNIAVDAATYDQIKKHDIKIFYEPLEKHLIKIDQKRQFRTDNNQLLLYSFADGLVTKSEESYPINKMMQSNLENIIPKLQNLKGVLINDITIDNSETIHYQIQNQKNTLLMKLKDLEDYYSKQQVIDSNTTFTDKQLTVGLVNNFVAYKYTKNLPNITYAKENLEKTFELIKSEILAAAEAAALNLLTGLISVREVKLEDNQDFAYFFKDKYKFVLMLSYIFRKYVSQIPIYNYTKIEFDIDKDELTVSVETAQILNLIKITEVLVKQTLGSTDSQLASVVLKYLNILRILFQKIKNIIAFTISIKNIKYSIQNINYNNNILMHCGHGEAGPAVLTITDKNKLLETNIKSLTLGDFFNKINNEMFDKHEATIHGSLYTVSNLDKFISSNIFDTDYSFESKFEWLITNLHIVTTLKFKNKYDRTESGSSYYESETIKSTAFSDLIKYSKLNKKFIDKYIPIVNKIIENFKKYSKAAQEHYKNLQGVQTIRNNWVDLLPTFHRSEPPYTIIFDKETHKLIETLLVGLFIDSVAAQSIKTERPFFTAYGLSKLMSSICGNEVATTPAHLTFGQRFSLKEAFEVFIKKQKYIKEFVLLDKWGTYRINHIHSGIDIAPYVNIAEYIKSNPKLLNINGMSLAEKYMNVINAVYDAGIEITSFTDGYVVYRFDKGYGFQAIVIPKNQMSDALLYYYFNESTDSTLDFSMNDKTFIFTYNHIDFLKTVKYLMEKYLSNYLREIKPDITAYAPFELYQNPDFSRIKTKYFYNKSSSGFYSSINRLLTKNKLNTKDPIRYSQLYRKHIVNRINLLINKIDEYYKYSTRRFVNDTEHVKTFVNMVYESLPILDAITKNIIQLRGNLANKFINKLLKLLYSIILHEANTNFIEVKTNETVCYMGASGNCVSYRYNDLSVDSIMRLKYRGGHLHFQLGVTSKKINENNIFSVLDHYFQTVHVRSALDRQFILHSKQYNTRADYKNAITRLVNKPAFQEKLNKLDKVAPDPLALLSDNNLLSLLITNDVKKITDISQTKPRKLVTKLKKENTVSDKVLYSTEIKQLKQLKQAQFHIKSRSKLLKSLKNSSTTLQKILCNSGESESTETAPDYREFKNFMDYIALAVEQELIKHISIQPQYTLHLPARDEYVLEGFPAAIFTETDMFLTVPSVQVSNITIDSTSHQLVFKFMVPFSRLFTLFLIFISTHIQENERSVSLETFLKTMSDYLRMYYIYPHSLFPNINDTWFNVELMTDYYKQTFGCSAFNYTKYILLPFKRKKDQKIIYKSLNDIVEFNLHDIDLNMHYFDWLDIMINENNTSNIKIDIIKLRSENGSLFSSNSFYLTKFKSNSKLLDVQKLITIKPYLSTKVYNLRHIKVGHKTVKALFTIISELTSNQNYFNNLLNPVSKFGLTYQNWSSIVAELFF